MIERPETTTIDKLFLELSQFTTAKTKRELELQRKYTALVEGLRKLQRWEQGESVGYALGNAAMERCDCGDYVYWDAVKTLLEDDDE